MVIPPLPPWDSLHPAVVHLPIGILLAAPLLIVLSLLWPKQRSGLMLAALLAIGLGLAAMQFAIVTGKAANEAVVYPSDEAKAVYHEHRDLAYTARLVYAGIAGVLLIVTAAVLIRGLKAPRVIVWGGSLLVLAGCIAGSLLIANVGHLGGRLVHQYGVLAPGITGNVPITTPGMP